MWKDELLKPKYCNIAASFVTEIDHLVLTSVSEQMNTNLLGLPSDG